MKPLVGLLRDKTPKFSDGTVGADVARMVKTFGRGMFVDVVKPKPKLGKNNNVVVSNSNSTWLKALFYQSNLSLFTTFHHSSP